MNLNLVFGLTGPTEGRHHSEFHCQQVFFQRPVIDRRVTIVINMLNCRATAAAGSSEAKIPATRSCSDAWASSNRQAP